MSEKKRYWLRVEVHRSSGRPSMPRVIQQEGKPAPRHSYDVSVVLGPFDSCEEAQQALTDATYVDSMGLWQWKDESKDKDAFSPGPWEIEEDGEFITIVDTRGYTICDMYKGARCVRANAILVTNAAALLATVQAIKRNTEDQEYADLEQARWMLSVIHQLVTNTLIHLEKDLDESE